MAKRIDFINCGTNEDWEWSRNKYSHISQSIPATIYYCQNRNDKYGLCLVVSEEWHNKFLEREDDEILKQ